MHILLTTAAVAAVAGVLLAQPAGAHGPPRAGEVTVEAKLRPVERSADDELIVEVVLDDLVLSSALFAYPHPGGTLLPLGQLLSLLELSVTVDPQAATAQGWLLTESRRFAFDLARGEVEVDGRRQPVDPAQVELHADDIYVDSKLLSSWLPFAVSLDRSALRLRVVPREKLPVQLRREREARRRGLAGGDGGEDRLGHGLDVPAHPFRLAGWPLLYTTARLEFRGGGEEAAGISGRQSLLAEGDLLGMNAELFLSAGQGETAADAYDRSRLALGRRDPGGRLLGILRATDFHLGDLTPALDPLISRGRPGLGFEIGRLPSSATLSWNGDADRTVLTGNALPGWDVELYRNGALFALQTAGGDGRYEFRDVPLQIGENLFRLVFYGPHGETREKVERILISAELPPAGETSYRLSLFRVDEGLLRRVEPEQGDTAPPGEVWGAAQVEHGFSRRLAVEGGLWSLVLTDGRHDYTRLGLRTAAFGATARFGLVCDSLGGQLAQIAFRRGLGRRLSLAVEHLELDGFRSDTAETAEGDLLSRTRARLDGQLALPGAAADWPQVPFSLEAMEDQRTTGRQLLLRGSSGLALPMGPVIVGSRWRVGMTGDTYTADGDLLANGRLGKVQWRGALSYGLLPEPSLAAVDLVGELRRQDGLGFRFSASQSLRQSATSLTASVDWPLSALVLGLDAGFSSRSGLRLGAAVSFGLARDPRAGHWRLRKAEGSAQGAVSARVYLDRDGNGRFDAGDQPLPGIGFKLDGRRHDQVTGGDGTAWLVLPSYRPVPLTLDESTFGELSWTSEREPVALLARPGLTWTEDFPVAATADLDGIVLLREGDGTRPASNVRLQLLDAAGTVVQETRSQFDGFYLFEKLRSGRYVLRADPEQTARLGLRTAEREITLAGGESQSGLELMLERVAPAGQ